MEHLLARTYTSKYISNFSGQDSENQIFCTEIDATEYCYLHIPNLKKEKRKKKKEISLKRMKGIKLSYI